MMSQQDLWFLSYYSLESEDPDKDINLYINSLAVL